MKTLIESTGRKRTLRSLARDRSGLALLEFALSLPIVLALGAYGLEISNLALLNMRISQIALDLADNASRVGTFSTLQTLQLREIDMNDVLQAARYQGQTINLTTNGRVILSSLENVQRSFSDGTSDSAPVQRIHWQRCVGLMGSTAAQSGYNSSYGTTLPTDGTDTAPGNDGTTAPTGMGDTGSKVTAPSGSGVMFVEINYLTKPLFGTWLTAPAKIHYIASYIVRDRRDFSQIFNPAPAVATSGKSTCNLYTT